MSRQIRVVVVMRNALGFETWSWSASCQRKYVSCTASGQPVASANTIFAVDTTSPPTIRPIGPSTRATMAPRRPPLTIGRAERASASPPMTTLINPIKVAVLAAIRSGVIA
jgi:hypothetical protein